MSPSTSPYARQNLHTKRTTLTKTPTWGGAPNVKEPKRPKPMPTLTRLGIKR
ncbi:hypothetical protein HanIR_Chr09g0409841 [Helianthus annuus]|nr:hypothetical protein HanIR_Chr09g0409841 [Helianthus annuus]